MKIIIANNTFFPYQRGGAEVIVRRLAEGWQKAGHEIKIVALSPDKDEQLLSEKSFDLSDEIETIFWPSSYYRLASMSWWWRLLWHLPDCFGTRLMGRWARLLSEFKPDLVVANNLTGLGYSLHFCCWRLGIKSVQVVHDLQYLHPSGLMIVGQEQQFSSLAAVVYQRLTASWLGYARLLISPSEWLINYHQRMKWLNRNKWLRLANASNDCLPQVYNQPQSLKVALFIGQLNQAKGIVWLANNWSKFNQRLSENNLEPVKLIIVGGGQAEADLKILAQNEKNLEVVGRVDSSEVNAYFKKADILIAPSFCYENWPTNLIEAAANGCLAITVSHGGSGELAKRLGYLSFEAGNLDSLSKAWLEAEQRISKKEKWTCLNDGVVVSPEEYLNNILNNISQNDK
ncbi:MAG TPA: glycosyltransferase [bacterium]|nr:glycosyltransferase [bacterium]